MEFRLLSGFSALFSGKQYRHRSGTQGDRLSLDFYEDLRSIDRSQKLVARIDSLHSGLNVKNVRTGIRARRGDGTFGELIPGQPILQVPGYRIARGAVATLDIGVEVKILNKAMVKQINDRISGLQKQADYFLKGRDGRSRGDPVTVAIVAVNHAPYTIGYEGDRAYRTDGTQNAHPAQEAKIVQQRLNDEVKPHFDEMVVLSYRATNDPPYPFEWVDFRLTEMEYGAALVRISREYERRF